MKFFARALLFAAAVTTAGRTLADTQDRHLSGFHAIDLAGSFDVYIMQGASESVKIDAPANLMSHIATDVHGDVLVLHEKNDHFSWRNFFNGHRNTVKIFVTVKDIHSIDLSGSGDVFFKDGLNASQLKMDISGSGDISGRVTAKSLECGISGSGDIKLAGRAETSSIRITGSGDFSGRGLAATNVMVEIAGSGDAAVNTGQRLDARISGSGDVGYSGSPKQIVRSISGSGEVHRL